MEHSSDLSQVSKKDKRDKEAGKKKKFDPEGHSNELKI